MNQRTLQTFCLILFSLLFITNFNFSSQKNICVFADNSTSDPYDYDSINRFSYQFNFNASMEQNISIPSSLAVDNEAIVQIYCHLFSNSTNNISLFIDGKGWNVTSIPVSIGQEVNITITNGIVNPEGGDVHGIKFKVWLFRENQTDSVYGLLTGVVLDSGWYPSPWPILPGVLALAILWTLRKRNRH